MSEEREAELEAEISQRGEKIAALNVEIEMLNQQVAALSVESNKVPTLEQQLREVTARHEFAASRLAVLETRDQRAGTLFSRVKASLEAEIQDRGAAE